MGLLLALSPVYVLTGWQWLPHAPLLWGLWPFGHLLLGILAGQLKGSLRAAFGAAGAASAAAAAFFLLPDMRWVALAVPSVILLYLVLIGAPKPPYSEWRVELWLGGAGVHIAGILAARAMEAVSATPALRALSFAYIPVFLLAVNRAALSSGVYARSGIGLPRRIRSGNRRIVIGISLAILLSVNFAAFRAFFYAAGNWLLAAIGNVLRWLSGLFASETPSGYMDTPAEMGMLPGGPTGEPSPIWRLLERVAWALAVAICAALLIFAGIRLCRTVKKLYERLRIRLRNMMAQLAEGVQEKTERILDWNEVRDAARVRVRLIRKRFTRPPRWQSMENRERVRWAYRMTMRDDAPLCRTARESLASYTDGERMADVYDAARYSDLAVSEADALFMRDAARRGDKKPRG